MRPLQERKIRNLSSTIGGSYWVHCNYNNKHNNNRIHGMGLRENEVKTMASTTDCDWFEWTASE